MNLVHIAEIAQSVSVLLASVAVICGVNAWRREFIGKRRIELAENTFAAFFKVVDAIAFIRNPWAKTGEGSSRESRSHETQEQKEILNRAYIVVERYNSKKDVFVEFQTIKYRFMAAFGRDTENIIHNVNRIVNDIFISANLLGTVYWERNGRGDMTNEEFMKHLKEREIQERIFWDTGGQDDDIRNKLDVVLKGIESATAGCFKTQIPFFERIKSKIQKVLSLWHKYKPTRYR